MFKNFNFATTDSVLFCIIVSVIGFLIIFALIALGIYGLIQVGYFVFFFKEATIFNLVKGFLALAITCGVPMGICICTDS